MHEQNWAEQILVGLAVGIVSGLSAAFLWFKGSKQRIYDRMDGRDRAVEQRLDRAERERLELWKGYNDHETQLRVLMTTQRHIEKTLDEIKDLLNHKVNNVGQ